MPHGTVNNIRKLNAYSSRITERVSQGVSQAMLYATATASLTVEAFSCDGLEKAGPEAIVDRYNPLLGMISI